MQRKHAIIKVEHANPDDGSYDIIISTEAVDRDGDVVIIDGWQLDNYRANPVVLFGHNYRDVPVGTANRVWVERGQLMANFSFREAGGPNDPVNWIRAAWDSGALRAASVGFRPIEREPLHELDEDDPFAELFYMGPWKFVKQELLEFSLVTVPANQEAVRRAAKDYVRNVPKVNAVAQNDADDDELNEIDKTTLTALMKAITQLYRSDSNE